MAIHAITDADIAILKNLRARVDSILRNDSIGFQDQDVVNQASDAYIVAIPAGGIPGIISGTSTVFATDPTTVEVRNIDGVDDIIDPAFTIEVNNVSSNDITSVYAIAVKTKFGKWVVADNLDSGTGTGGGGGCTCSNVPISTDIPTWMIVVDPNGVTSRLDPEDFMLDFSDVLVDPDDCWIGVRTGTGSGQGTDDADNPDTLFHKKPGTLLGEADCSFVHRIDGVFCYLKVDDAGHVLGGFSATLGSWQSPFFPVEP